MMRIRYERLQRGWTQMALSDYSGVRQADISAIEIGRLIPTLKELEKLGRAFGLPADELQKPATVVMEAVTVHQPPRETVGGSHPSRGGTAHDKLLVKEFQFVARQKRKNKWPWTDQTYAEAWLEAFRAGERDYEAWHNRHCTAQAEKSAKDELMEIAATEAMAS